MANDMPLSPASPYPAALRGQARRDPTGLWTNYTEMRFIVIRTSYRSEGAVETCYIVACMRNGAVRRLSLFVFMASERGRTT